MPESIVKIDPQIAAGLQEYEALVRSTECAIRQLAGVVELTRELEMSMTARRAAGARRELQQLLLTGELQQSCASAAKRAHPALMSKAGEEYLRQYASSLWIFHFPPADWPEGRIAAAELEMNKWERAIEAALDEEGSNA